MNAPSAGRDGGESHNPFATKFLRPGALKFMFADGDRIQHAGDLIRQLERQGFHGQIVGPHGSGKSTLLRNLAIELEANNIRAIDVRLNDQNRRLPATLVSEVQAADQPTVVLVDGYEQLLWWRRVWLRSICRRYQVGLVVTAHTDMGLPELYRTEVTIESARRVIASLCRQQAVEADGSVQLRERVERLTRDLPTRLAEHQGNLRDLLFELYDDVVAGEAAQRTK